MRVSEASSNPEPGRHISDRWAAWRREIDLAEYHTRWVRMEADGSAAHGEADLIASYGPATVLDAGCGMGRVAIELARRGIDVDGVDLDDDLLAFARVDAPHLRWFHGDLATMRLPRRYALVAMPGNVMLFCDHGVRAAIVANLADHLLPGGLLMAGFGLERRADAITLDEYDAAADGAGLQLVERFATWEREPFAGGNYAVSVHCAR
jgi:SAM-dependent methyltransferase